MSHRNNIKIEITADIRKYETAVQTIQYNGIRGSDI